MSVSPVPHPAATLYMFRLVYIAAAVLWRAAVGGVDALVPSPHRAADTTAASRNSSHNRSVAPRTGARDLFTDNITSFIDNCYYQILCRYHVNLDKRFSELIVHLDIPVVLSIKVSH